MPRHPYDMVLSALKRHLWFNSLTIEDQKGILHPEIRIFPVTDEDFQLNGIPG